jgi:general secretion pathway protein G
MRLRTQGNRRRRAAFTLMEMLVVVAIIVALAGIATYFLIPALAQGQRDIARTSAMNLGKVVMTYKIQHHTYPGSLQQLTQNQPNGGPPLLEPNDLKDPWGGTYQMDPSGQMNQGRRPDIFTIDPSDNSKVGNWPDTKQ